MNGSPDIASRQIRSVSCKRPSSRSCGTPNWFQKAGRKPREIVVTSRPPERLSITANCSAAFIGCTSVPTNVKLPSMTRVVSRASTVSSCSGPGNAHSGRPCRSGTCTE